MYCPYIMVCHRHYIQILWTSYSLFSLNLAADLLRFLQEPVFFVLECLLFYILHTPAYFLAFAEYVLPLNLYLKELQWLYVSFLYEFLGQA